jgi:hypothetical protein
MDSDIYMHVSDKDSAAYFPQNRPSIFRVKLKTTLNLTGSWKIGVCCVDMTNIDVKRNKATGVSRLFITCSACTGLIVNGEQTRVLRCIELEHDVHEVYTDIFYVPVEVSFLDSIEFTVITDLSTYGLFELKDASDDNIGIVSMTLHLKRCS